MCAIALDLWGEMLALERRVDDLFRSFLGPRARWLFPTLGRGLHRPFVPATDVLAKDGTLVIRIDRRQGVRDSVVVEPLDCQRCRSTGSVEHGLCQVCLEPHPWPLAGPGGRYDVSPRRLILWDEPPPPRARMVKVLV